MLEWFVATTKPLREEQAERELRRQGFFAAVPKVRRRIEQPGKEPRYERRPYLRGYVVLYLDLELDWWPAINNTRGVGKLVMTGGIPSRIWRGAEDELVAMCLSGELVADERKMDEAVLAAGDEAVVREGPFSGHSGVVNDVDLGHARVGLMLEMFWIRNRFEFSRTAIWPAATS